MKRKWPDPDMIDDSRRKRWPGAERATVALLTLVMAVAFLSGCAFIKSMTIPSTPEGKYLAARVWYNKAVGNYVWYYDEASAETQAVWKDKIDPIVLAGFTALDAWKLGISEGVPAGDLEREFLSVKRKLLNLLLTHQIK